MNTKPRSTYGEGASQVYIQQRIARRQELQNLVQRKAQEQRQIEQAWNRANEELHDLEEELKKEDELLQHLGSIQPHVDPRHVYSEVPHPQYGSAAPSQLHPFQGLTRGARSPAPPSESQMGYHPLPAQQDPRMPPEYARQSSPPAQQSAYWTSPAQNRPRIANAHIIGGQTMDVPGRTYGYPHGMANIRSERDADMARAPHYQSGYQREHEVRIKPEPDSP